MRTLFLLASILAITGCTDATRAHYGQFNDPSHIQCFSGGKVIYDGHSTGIVESNQGEDGVYFKERESGKFVRLYADCVIRSQ